MPMDVAFLGYSIDVTPGSFLSASVGACTEANTLKIRKSDARASESHLSTSHPTRRMAAP